MKSRLAATGANDGSHLTAIIGGHSNRRGRATVVDNHPCPTDDASTAGSKWKIPRLGCTSLLCLALISTAALIFSIRLFSREMSPMPSPRAYWRLGEEPGPPARPDHQVAGVARRSPRNILCIFTGRWTYLRINFAYVYRSLRTNGGVLDKVYYIMIQYDTATLSSLAKLAEAANRFLGEEVFEFRFLNHEKDKTVRPKNIFAQFYFTIFDEMVKYPERKYFKMDDDIVYIHPGTFMQLIRQQNTSECFMHFANIGGANWRSSYIHQEMGIFDNPAINPKKVRFEFYKFAECGWKSAECAEVALRAFFYHYENRSLERFLFDGRYLTPERARYSINMFMLDVNLIDLKALLDSGPMKPNDEKWWTENYSRRVKNPNCVVGGAFVVHFSYATNQQEVLKLDFLQKFEIIAYKDLVSALPEVFQTILGFDPTVGA